MKITGDTELIALLNSITKTKAKAAIRKGSRAGCKVILPVAVSLAPVVTGQLQAALKVRALPRSRKWVGTQVTAINTGAVYWAGFVMLGTKHNKGNNFMRKATDEVQAAATKTFTQGITGSILGT